MESTDINTTDNTSVVTFDKNTLPPLEIMTLTPIGIMTLPIEKKEEGEKKKPSFLLNQIIEIPTGEEEEEKEEKQEEVKEKKNKTSFGPYLRPEKIKIDQAILNYWSAGGLEAYKDMIFFIEKNQVKKHIHSECPYTHCEFSTRCKTDLKDHLNAIHIHYICHFCDICQNGYTSVKGLSRHKRQAHKN